MTGPRLVLASETLFTTLSGHGLFPDGSRICSPLFLVVFKNNYITLNIWQQLSEVGRETTEKHLCIKPAIWAQTSFSSGRHVSIYTLYSSFLISHYPLLPQHPYAFPQKTHVGVVQPYFSFSCSAFVTCNRKEKKILSRLSISIK